MKTTKKTATAEKVQNTYICGDCGETHKETLGFNTPNRQYKCKNSGKLYTTFYREDKWNELKAMGLIGWA